MQAARNPLVSVLIPAFNASSFLERAVTSVLNQTLKSVEIVIVDDASTDGTYELAEHLSAKHGIIRVVALRENGGPAVARNAAMQAASGEWLAILDADDAYDADHLERLQLIASQHYADVILSNFCYFDPASHTRGSEGVSQQDLPRSVDRYEYVASARPYLSHQDWGLLKPMLRAAFVKSHSISYPTFSRHGEDFLMMLDCLLAGGKVVISPSPTYLYTHRGHGWSRTAIDYQAMVAQSAALIRDPRIAYDHEMVRLLKSRIAALERLAGENRGRSLLKDRRLGELLLRAVTDCHVRSVTARLVLRRLRNLFVRARIGA